MRKNLFISLLFLILLLSSCSVQEKISPEIFKSRIEKAYPEFIFENDGYYVDNCFYVFALRNNNNVVFKIIIDENNTANKISVSFENAKEISNIIRPIIDIFSPNEDYERIITDFKRTEDGFYYSYGKDYTYSLAIKGKSVYFEAFNNRYSGYVAPELTLKQNDKITF